MARVTGRLIKKPITTIDVAGECVRIRVDDDANPEFWIEVLLTESDLVMVNKKYLDSRPIRDVLPFNGPETPKS